jgi:hypothetical protein
MMDVIAVLYATVHENPLRDAGVLDEDRAHREVRSAEVLPPVGLTLVHIVDLGEIVLDLGKDVGDNPPAQGVPTAHAVVDDGGRTSYGCDEVADRPPVEASLAGELDGGVDDLFGSNTGAVLPSRAGHALILRHSRPVPTVPPESDVDPGVRVIARPYAPPRVRWRSTRTGSGARLLLDR